MRERAFDRFIAIDWSGAAGRRHRAIEVAECAPGRDAPVRVAPPGGCWSREAVLAFVTAQAGTRALIGFDFSFAPPYLDRGHYLPGCPHQTAPAFWAFVDAEAPDEDLGAARLVETALRPHFYFGASCGARAPFARLRRCEAQVRRHGLGTPSSLFVCIGSSQVGKASLAGMRLLHRLRASGIAVWPFDPLPARGPVVVEIFPRLFIRRALAGHGGRANGKIASRDSLNRALGQLGADPADPARPLTRADNHLADALVSSAGLRHLAEDPRVWQPDGLTPIIARTEGWIFGVA